MCYAWRTTSACPCQLCQQPRPPPFPPSISGPPAPPQRAPAGSSCRQPQKPPPPTHPHPSQPAPPLSLKHTDTHAQPSLAHAHLRRSSTLVRRRLQHTRTRPTSAPPFPRPPCASAAHCCQAHQPQSPPGPIAPPPLHTQPPPPPPWAHLRRGSALVRYRLQHPPPLRRVRHKPRQRATLARPAAAQQIACSSKERACQGSAERNAVRSACMPKTVSACTHAPSYLAHSLQQHRRARRRVRPHSYSAGAVQHRKECEGVSLHTHTQLTSVRLAPYQHFAQDGTSQESSTEPNAQASQKKAGNNPAGSPHRTPCSPPAVRAAAGP